MTGIAGIILRNDSFLVSGDINFASAVSLWNDSLPLLSKSKELIFDFSGVIHANSSALALLIEWIKYAKQNNKSISFIKLPEQLRSIAAVGGIDKLLMETPNELPIGLAVSV